MAMSGGLTVGLGAYQVLANDFNPEVTQRVMFNTPLAIAGAGVEEYASAQITSRLLSNAHMEAAALSSAGRNRLAARALGRRVAPASGMAFVVAPAVESGTMLLEEMFTDTDYTNIDYMARSTRAGITAAGGAAIGMAVGSVVPVAGTAVGFVAGFVAGMAIDYFAGDAIERGIRVAAGEEGCVPAPAQTRSVMSNYGGPIFACFTGQTNICLSDHSLRPISQLKVGDSLLSFNPDENEFETTKVTRIISKPAMPCLKIWVDAFDGPIEATSEHPFYAEGEWVRAAELKPKMALKQVINGEMYSTAVSKVTHCSGKKRVFNITVSGCHTYFANGVLVHNK